MLEIPNYLLFMQLCEILPFIKLNAFNQSVSKPVADGPFCALEKFVHGVVFPTTVKSWSNNCF